MSIFESEFFQNSKFHWDFLQKYEKKEQWEILSNQFKERSLNASKIQKIPKTIHQIWIGPQKLPNRYRSWMKSWLKYNPEYKYILWRDKDIEKLKMINHKKFKEANNPGIKSDIARYEILYLYGGIYIDTDFECISKIPDILHNYDFVSSTIFDFKPCIANGFMMSKNKSKVLKEIIKNLKLVNKEFNINDTIINIGPGLLTREYFKLKKEIRVKYLILPSNFFYPYPNFLLSSNYKRYEMIEQNSIGLHHWEMSWMKGNFIIRVIKKLNLLFVNYKNMIFNKK